MVVAPIEFAVYLSYLWGWHYGFAQACEAACLLFKAFDAFTGKDTKERYMRVLRKLRIRVSNYGESNCAVD